MKLRLALPAFEVAYQVLKFSERMINVLGRSFESIGPTIDDLEERAKAWQRAGELRYQENKRIRADVSLRLEALCKNSEAEKPKSPQEIVVELADIIDTLLNFKKK